MRGSQRDAEPLDRGRAGGGPVVARERSRGGSRARSIAALARWTLVLASLWLPAAARAQGSDLRGTDPLRDPERLREEPLAISVLEREEILLGRPAVDIEEALDLVPGVFAQSSRNSAQDTRVAIRGYGASAQFGIRGIRVLVDGVPTTLPDGQSEVDSIDLAFVDRVDVVRGPISSLYGGGGGGILSFTTVGPTDEPTFSSRVVFGSHNLSRYEALARGRAGATGWVAGLAYTRYSGYRDAHLRHGRGACAAEALAPAAQAARPHARAAPDGVLATARLREQAARVRQRRPGRSSRRPRADGTSSSR